MLILTDGVKPNVFLSGRNLPLAHVMPFSDVSTYHILWSDVVLVESGALGEAMAPMKEKELAKVKVVRYVEPDDRRRRDRRPKTKRPKAKAEKKAVKKKAATKAPAAREGGREEEAGPAKAAAKKAPAKKAAPKKKGK